MLNQGTMLYFLLLLCTLYKITAGALLQPVTGKGVPTQALNSIDRGSWNKSTSFSNNTGPGIWAVSGPSLNITGQSLWDSLNLSSDQALWSSLDTYNNVSSLASD